MRSFLLCFFLLPAVYVHAQSKTQLSVGIGVTPLAAFSINFSSSQDQVNSGSSMTFREYADSVSSHETYRFSFGVHCWANYLLSQKWSLQGGIGYIDIGFQRQQKNIKFRDPLFPGIGDGRLIELSGSDKSIDYNYRYQYIQVPVMLNYNFRQSRDHKWLYYMSGGLGLNVLVNHEIKANLDQFVMDGETTFNLDSTGYEGRLFGVNLMVGGKAEYRYEKRITAFIQPTLAFYPLSVSKSPVSVLPLYFGVTLGAVYTLDN